MEDKNNTSTQSTQEVTRLVDTKAVLKLKKSINSCQNSILKLINKKSDDYYLKVKNHHLSGKGKIKNLEDIINFILGHPFFKGHRFGQLLIHKRGSLKIQSISNTKKEEHQTDLQNFNNLFQTIKKSKFKIFNSNQFDYSLNCVGTFLAKEISIAEYNVIFIISRFDFLVPTKEEIDFFEKTILRLVPTIDYLLAIYENEYKNSLLKKLITNFPLPISANHKGKNIFKSFIPSNQKGHITETILRGEFEITIYKNNMIEESSFYHFQRVALLGELLNTLGHELSNPLFGLHLTAELLHDSHVNNPELADFINEIAIHSKRCQTIIKNFSDLYDNEESIREINIENLVREVISLTKSETRSIKKNIILSDDINNKLITTNPTWLNQILFNLVINAAQSLKENSISEPAINIYINKNKNNDLVLRVQDNGPGPKDKDIEKIFSPFFTTKSMGTGLGLSICKNLASKMNSKLYYNRENDHPSFNLELCSTQ